MPIGNAVVAFVLSYALVGLLAGELYRFTCRVSKRNVIWKCYTLGAAFWPVTVYKLFRGRRA